MPLLLSGLMKAVSFLCVTLCVCDSTYLWCVLGVVGWITQLVVNITVRKRYIATHLLQTLKNHPLFSNVSVVGLVSSHPAACDALAKYACRFIYIRYWKYCY